MNGHKRNGARRARLRRFSLIAAGFVAAAALGACGTLRADPAPAPLTLTQTSYYAADMMSQQTQGSVRRDTPLAIGAITDMAHPSAQTALGQAIANQIAARFVQLGYHVTAAHYAEMNAGAPMMNSGALNNGTLHNGTMNHAAMNSAAPYAGAVDMNAAYIPPVAAVSHNALLSGQYALARDVVMVNLRMIDTSSQRAVAAFDYTVPLTRDIRTLAQVPGTRKGLFGL